LLLPSRSNNDIPYKYTHKLIRRCGYLASFSSESILAYEILHLAGRFVTARNEPLSMEKLADVAKSIHSNDGRIPSRVPGYYLTANRNRRYEAIGYSYSRKSSTTFRHEDVSNALSIWPLAFASSIPRPEEQSLFWIFTVPSSLRQP